MGVAARPSLIGSWLSILYTGPPLLMTGVVQTLNFGCYDLTLRALTRTTEGTDTIENAPLTNFFVAGFTGWYHQL